ncbi:hypothetical protein NLG97_g4834 [Lecanicillium saksenae]|uniref:Uncharacterized protein n=1 Tax=Lecanicillium saksenae TaxID=468837 RepID=A0ACC1QY30_9HYPO|nr:hypothetical protein NLG97_g4834 [Lecanicillium saksenae]
MEITLILTIIYTMLLTVPGVLNTVTAYRFSRSSYSSCFTPRDFVTLAVWGWLLYIGGVALVVVAAVRRSPHDQHVYASLALALLWWSDATFYYGTAQHRALLREKQAAAAETSAAKTSPRPPPGWMAWQSNLFGISSIAMLGIFIVALGFLVVSD